jgi:hypothetical protein
MEQTLGRQPGSTSSASSRAELFKAYMDFICVDDNDQPFTLQASTDFLGRGQDAGGKADFQGCSEFNPLRVFSQQEQQRLNQPANKAERDRENAPNRRVVIFLFRAGSRVDPQRWPCPRAKEGTAGCIKRFHLDGNTRRNPTGARREFESDGNTFACRFYHHRIATLSPCERILPKLACCKHRGVVVDNVDPLAMGRLRVDVPELFDGQPRFALPATPYAGDGVGFCMLPPVGAGVWVDFEQGDVNRPVWSGCFWQPGEPPPEIDQPGATFIKTETTSLVMNESAGQAAFTLQAIAASVTAQPGAMNLESTAARVELTPAAVNINDEGIKVT